MARLPATIRTARLTLRPLRAGDADAIVSGIGNYDVVRWLSSPPYPYGQQDAANFIAGAGNGVFVVDDGAGLQGVFSIGSELGYWLARGAWGRGYATEAGDALTDRWFADGRTTPLYSNHYLGNDASAGVLRKLGFVDIGERAIHSNALRQDMIARQMALSRDRWAARRTYRLRTRRLRLRELRDGDLPAIRRIGGDPRVAPMVFAATSPWPEAAARTWLETSRYRGRLGFRAAICTRLGRLIGTVFIGRAPGGGPVTCAWFLDPAYWGRGLATEAVGAFLADTMDQFGIDALWADHFMDNPASGAVMNKLGFVQTGTGTGTSGARLEPATVVIYRLDRSNLKVPR